MVHMDKLRQHLSFLLLILLINDQCEQLTIKQDPCKNKDVTCVGEHYSKRIIALHNIYRSKHGVYPLDTSEKLMIAAQAWATKLACMERLQHSEAHQKGEVGENLAAFYQDVINYKAEQTVDYWYTHIRRHYNYNLNKHQPGTGYFTQFLWKDSKKIGVGNALSDNGTIYVVAQYTPPGNKDGKYKDNVRPIIPTCGGGKR